MSKRSDFDGIAEAYPSESSPADAEGTRQRADKIFVQTVKLSRDVHTRLSTHGLKTDQKKQAMIVRAILEYLDKHEGEGI